MDALIVLFVIGAFILSLTKKANKPKKQNPDAEKTVPPQSAPAEKIPFTKEEWNEYLRAQGIARKKTAAAPGNAEPQAKSVSAAELTADKSAVTRDARLRPSAPPAGSREMVDRMHRAVERGMPGAVSAQGESEAEHAEHLRKMHDADQENRAQSETLRELRSMNRARLRQAVIMREILDRPVSMRNE